MIFFLFLLFPRHAAPKFLQFGSYRNRKHYRTRSATLCTHVAATTVTRSY